MLLSGDLLLSFTTAGTVGGLSVDDSDIVQFSPTSLGATTSGTFSLYFDGSDVGLSSNGEDIDAMTLASDGRLIVSMSGNFSANGASGADEDLVTFNATSLGDATAGSFEWLVDGSDVGLTSVGDDIDGATLTLAGDILMSPTAASSVLPAQDEDVLQFIPTLLGNPTSGSFAMFLDLTTLSIDSTEDIGSLHIED